MALTIILFFIFLGSLGVLWYRISLKIPELVAIPDQVITERLHEDSAQVHLFVLHIKTFYREGKFREMFTEFIAKVLYKLHIGLLRFDNTLIEFLRKLREGGAMVNGSMPNIEYWKELRSEQIVSPIVELEGDTQSQKSVRGNRIDEVRKKKI